MNSTDFSIYRAGKAIYALSLMCILGWIVVPATQADDDIKLSARLVWGTNRDKPADNKLKPISHELKAKFVNIFKWKDYYEISNKPFQFPKHEGKKVRMSPKC